MDKAANWRGGRRLNNFGYVIITVPGKRGVTLEHRWLWEQANGPIPDGYTLHHIDGDKANNDLANLQLVTNAEHARLHHKGIRHPMYGKHD